MEDASLPARRRGDEKVIQPSGDAVFENDGALDNGEAAIQFRHETGEMIHSGCGVSGAGFMRAT